MFHFVRTWLGIELLFVPLRPRKRRPKRRSTLAQHVEYLQFERLEIRELLTGSGYFPTLTISSPSAPEGGVLSFTVAWSGVGQGGQLTVSAGGGNAVANVDYLPVPVIDKIVGDSGSLVINVSTIDDGNDPDHDKQIQSWGQIYTSVGAEATASATGQINENSGSYQCHCSCSCGNVEPTTNDKTGRPLVNSGQGAQPNDLFYDGDQRPHPIATVNDTLSSTVASATGITVQTTLDDLSGNVLYTSPTVYYSPAGYTQGQQVQFSQMLDATGLADGSYQFTTTVSEQYSGRLPVMRSYSSSASTTSIPAPTAAAGR